MLVPKPAIRYNRVMPFQSLVKSVFLTLLAATLAFTPLRVFSQESWKPPRLLFWYSDNLNPVTGGDDLLSVHYAVGRLEDHFLKPSPWNEDWWLGKSTAIGYRLLKLNFVDYSLLDFFTAIPQHEIFGHGYRAREFSFEDLEYEFSPPQPYGGGFGLTTFSYPRQGKTVDQELAISIGGVEASQVMAEKLRGYWFQAGNMDYHGALLYLTTVGDLRNYLAQTDEKKLDTDPDYSNDMLNYVTVLNGKVDRTQRQNFRLHLSRMEDNSRIALLDPFLWYAYWTVFKTHLWSGQSVFEYPAIPVGPLRFIPCLGYGLTPWGPEYLFDNLLALDSRTLNWRVRIGDDTFRRSWGTDLDATDVISIEGFTCDIGLHLWSQPRLRLSVNDQGKTPTSLGGGGSLNLFSPTLDLPFPIKLAGGGGYKTSGFIAGADMESGFAWHFGLDISL
jgi:hypothetical protein